MSEFDWYEMACEPALVELGAVVRETLGAWVGFLDRDGRAIPVGSHEVALKKSPCEQIRVNALRDESGETTSCLDSVRSWVRRARREGAFETSCHAGFGARVRPIAPDSTGFLGAVYLSGYFRADRAEAKREELGALLERSGLGDYLDAGAVEEVPALEASARRMAGAVVGRLASYVEERVDRDPEGTGVDVEGREPPRFEGMIGGTRSMRSLFEQIETVADSDSTVLIEGENGTGKELVARALHRRSGRSDREFVAVNCAALPAELIESELFGHKKGAFSGAHRDREGLCVEADRGTLLLDEIGDMEKSLQSKLLRFLQDGRFTPVGANQARSVDVRVLCATNQDLEGMVETGAFRKDLYFRLNVIRMRVPSLRERRSDIPLLVDHFLHRAADEHGGEPPEVTDACRERLETYDWPGNVRELKNEIDRLVIMASGEGPIDVDALSPRVVGESGAISLPETFEGMTIPEATERLERKLIVEGLRATGWNKTRTAERLDVSRRTLIRKVSDYGLEEYRSDE